MKVRRIFPLSTHLAPSQPWRSRLSPYELGPLSARLPQPVIPLDAKARLLSVFLELRDVPNAMCSHLLIFHSVQSLKSWGRAAAGNTLSLR